MFDWRCISISAVLVASVAPPAESGVPIEWPVADGGNGNYYEVILDFGVPWEDANTAAGELMFRGVNGHLATMTSAPENQFIVENLLNAGNLWLGGLQPDPDVPPNEGWAWVTGEAWEYTNWWPGEPNDSSGDEHFLQMNDNGEWNDNLNGTLDGYLVEYPVGSPPCPWDLNDNGAVGVTDLLLLLALWGPCKGCPADFDGNGNVGVSDLLALLANWGPCP